MSNQSGILADRSLLDTISQSLNEKTGKLVIITARISTDSTKVELDNVFSSVPDLLKALTTDPLYVFLKDPATTADQYNFISYVPDPAPVRLKMLYASTKNTLVRQIGGNSINKQLLLTEPEEISESVENVNDKVSSTAILTDSERAGLEIAEQQRIMRSSMGNSRGHQLVSQTDGSPTPLTFNVANGKEIKDLLDEFNVISFGINMSNEQVEVTKHAKISKMEDLEITENQPSYTIVKNGTASFFIYSCPSGSKVRDRMVYASNRTGFVNYLQTNDKLNFAKIIEIGDPDELELSLLSESPEDDKTNAAEGSISTPASHRESKFSRPRGPARKRRD